MRNIWLSWNDTVDPKACNTNPKVYESYTRDPERSPFQWDDSMNAGFSTSSKTWLPVADNYKQINVKIQLAATKSHLLCYKNLMELRKTKTMQNGGLRAFAPNQFVLVIKR